MPRAAQQNRVFDGFTSLESGMDGGSATNLIPRNKFFFGNNVTSRGGYVNNRPAFNNYNLSFTDSDTSAAYINGRFQGAEWYIPNSGDPFVFISVSGHIYRGIPTMVGFSIEDLTPVGDPNKSDLPTVWMCQADSFMVIQDGLDGPFVYDGNQLRRSQQGPQPGAIDVTPTDQRGWYEVPTGTAMAYGYGRLFLAVGKNVLGGDVLNASIPNSAIRFSEIVTKQDAFAVPVTSGNITALNFGATLNTNLGQGPLQAHTQSGQIITLNITVDRASWLTEENIQTIAMQGGASVGQFSLANVNGDTWYRSHDGVRSFIVASRDFGTWGNTPQSREMRDILNDDTDELVQYASAVCFDNRLLVTVSPQKAGANRYFQGLIAIDFDLLGALADTIFGGVYGSTPKPAWEGVWTGINVTQITKAFFGSNERCFLFTYDPVNGNGVSELTKDGVMDNGNCPIASVIETGSYNFNQLTMLKKLAAADIWIDQLQGNVDFDVKWLPEQSAFWTDWQTFSESDGGICFQTNPLNNRLVCQMPVMVPPQYRSRLRLQEPDLQPDNPQVDYPGNVGYDFRFRIAWTGRCRIKGFRVQAMPQTDDTTGSAPS